jgi:uncharacterized membrane protein YphA (DoxX/SURF4 family)
MKNTRLTIVLRVLLGLIFVAGPLATALHLIPDPAMPPKGAAFAAALAQTGYMLPLLWNTEIAAGVLLLSGLFVPVALLMLAPVIVNIAAFHLFLVPSGMPTAIVVTALEVSLAWRYREAYRPLFKTARSQPVSIANEIREHAA